MSSNNTFRNCAIGCAAVVGFFGLGIFALFMALGIAMEMGYVADSKARGGADIQQPILDKLKDQQLIEPGEKVHWFYSESFLDVSAAGNLFTDRRVISYETLEGEFYLYEATYPEISDITLEDSDSFWDDAIITVELHNGDWFSLLVSAEEQGDNKFYEDLVKTWKENRAEEGNPRAEPAP